MKYRKKPVVIDAMKFDGSRESAWELCKFHEDVTPATSPSNGEFLGSLFVNTLEGQMVASPGDYIIIGVKGEAYPCKADIFELTYEPVNE